MDKISKRFVGFHTSFFSCIFNASFQLRFAYISSLVIAVFINRYGLDFELVIGESIKQQLCRTGFCRVFPGDAVSTLRVNALLPFWNPSQHNHFCSALPTDESRIFSSYRRKYRQGILPLSLRLDDPWTAVPRRCNFIVGRFGRL